MKLPQNLTYKIYFLLFGWLCLGEFATLITPQADAFIYYNTLKILYPSASIFYILAIFRAVINLICLFPLFTYAFNKNIRWPWLLKLLLILRIIADISGHNYEWLFLKSLFYSSSVILPFASIGLYIAIYFLSYKAHFICATKK